MNKFNPYSVDDDEMELPKLKGEVISNETSKKGRKKKKLRLRIQVIVFMFIIFLGLSFISLSKILKWKSDNDNTEKIMNEVTNVTEIIEVEDTQKTEIINPPEREEENPYWDYIKMNLIDVDISELKNKNEDTVGWIKVNGTNINYPIVQSKDNEYYLKRDFNKKYSNAGWVFMDYRNKLNDFDKNTIIYAHGRVDGTMFGSLKNIFNNGWFENKDNHIVKLSSEYNNSMWQVFSVYIVPETNDYLDINFNNSDNYLEFLYKLESRSKYEFDVLLNKDDKILTLSTCYNENERVVLHAKLIKMEVKNSGSN